MNTRSTSNYYPCLDATRGWPFGLFLHGNEGTEGAENGVTVAAQLME